MRKPKVWKIHFGAAVGNVPCRPELRIPVQYKTLDLDAVTCASCRYLMKTGEMGYDAHKVFLQVLGREMRRRLKGRYLP
jgi:hypothetical protein